MADGVFHTGYGIKINLNLPDLDHPEYPDLRDEITRPIAERDRMLLECIEHRRTGYCRAEGDQHLPWMSIRRRTVNGVTTLVAAHLPLRTVATAEESDKHKAMKERIARVAGRHGLRAEVEALASDRKIRTDVLRVGA